MNRKIAAVIGIAVAAIAVWFFALRGGGDAPPPPAPGSAARAPDPWSGPRKPDTPSAPSAPAGATRFERDDDPVGALRLEGQVLDADDQPVAGATVWLGSAPPRTTTSEADGSFGFDKLVGRTYAVAARVGDRLGGPVEYTLTATSSPVVVRLHAGQSLAVIVTAAADGKPIASARVEVRGLMEQAVSTDADGKAVLRGVGAGWMALAITAEGWAPTTLAQIREGQADLRITMQRGGPVSGRVLDDAGAPVAGARVIAKDVGRYFDTTSADKDGALTDADGRFKLAAVPPGSYRFIASDETHAPGASPPITLDGASPKEGVEITLKAAAAVAGRVITADKQPAPYATIRLGPKAMGGGDDFAGAVLRQVVADADGKFALKGLPRTEVRIRAESDVAASAIVDVDLSGGAPKGEVVLVLDVSGTIAGVVVDGVGEPVAEAQVSAMPDFLAGGGKVEDAALAGFSSATTDGGGRFTIHGLPDGSYRLWAQRGGGNQQGWNSEGTPAKPGDLAVRLVLPAPGGISGKLALENGKSPDAATVQVGWMPGTSAKGGSFALTELTPGRYDITVRGPEFAQVTKGDIVVEAGKTTDLGTIQLKRGRKVTGRVTTSDGAPVPGAKVQLGAFIMSQGTGAAGAEMDPEQWGLRMATTGDDGGFAIVGVGPDGVSIIAEHPTLGRSDALTVAAGQGDPPPIQLRLHGYGVLAGKVTSAGKPVGGASLTASQKSGGAHAVVVQTGPDGTFLIDKIPEGAHHLTVMQMSGMGAATTGAEASVVAGKRTDIAIDIPVGDIALTVEVKPKAGATVDAAQVFLFGGVIAAKNGKDLRDVFLQGGSEGAGGMKFWFGADFPKFEKLTAGTYSVCTVPITGSMSDPTFMQRLQSQSEKLDVYCVVHPVKASPTEQRFVHEVPSMKPLPPPEGAGSGSGSGSGSGN